jgi:hypothetical protein
MKTRKTNFIKGEVYINPSTGTMVECSKTAYADEYLFTGFVVKFNEKTNSMYKDGIETSGWIGSNFIHFVKDVKEPELNVLL